MHKYSLLSKILLLSCICLTFSSNSLAAVPLDGIAAIVDDQVITSSTLQQHVLTMKHQLQQRNIKLPADRILSKQVLQMMISQSLVEQTAKRLNITASTADVNHALHSIATQQKITITQLYQSLQKHGMSKNAFMTELKKKIITEKLMQEVVGTKLNVSSQEIDAGIKIVQHQAGAKNEFHLLHILIPIKESHTPTQVAATAKKAQQIMKQAKRGENFETLAAAQSSGSQTFKGGDMGWKTLTELPTVFADRVLTMRKGDVVGPIRTANGFHIIKLAEVRGNPLNMDAVQLRTHIRNMILQRKLAEKQQAWLQQLRAAAYVNVLQHP